MARRSGKAQMAWVRSFRKNSPKRSALKNRRRRRTRARRNAFPLAGLVVNPRRRRRHLRANPRRRRSYRRNPSILGLNLSMPPLKQVLFAGVGFVGTPVLESFINPYLPTSITSNTFGKYAVKIGSVIALAFAVKKVVGQAEGQMVAIGGGAYVLTSAVSEFAPGVIPGLSAYVAPNRQRYAGMGAYVPMGQRPMGQRVARANQLGLPVSGGSAFGRGNVAIGGTADRFRKF